MNEDTRIELQEVAENTSLERMTAGVAMLDTVLEISEEENMTLEELRGAMSSMRTVLAALAAYKMEQESGE